ncbi:hypothetical protein HMPREF0322_03834 [Desulfitobacterium hafniense DP7]|uniref:Uncharacterized protein n=1 Tax=Desulfitobacterium hafniense DP7 TaxID=537010 RepID=G9XS85_DESHA|nr:hypothetical protein HMPREF0322_03834 [Desulfitobacterium hafniense DP7]
MGKEAMADRLDYGHTHMRGLQFSAEALKYVRFLKAKAAQGKFLRPI